MAIIKINDDLKTVTITYDPPIFSVEHTTELVDELLVTLGEARSGMLPKIPDVWKPATVTAERDPKHSVGASPLSADPVLHLRDALFGWRHYVFTKSEARKLAEALIAQADAEPPAPAGTA